MDHFEVNNNSTSGKANETIAAIGNDPDSFSNALINAIPQQIWTADALGEVNNINQVVCSDFGLSREKILDLKWTSFIHPDDLELSIATWENSIATGAAYRHEFRLLFADGNYYWHLSKANKIQLAGNVVWVGTNTNINEHKKMELQKDEFLSIASHELKTPLTTIKGYTQLLLRTVNDAKILPYIERTAGQLDRLGKLIDDLMNVSKINAGKMALNKDKFNFSRMLADTIAGMQHVNPSHQIQFTYPSDIYYYGDRYRIEQVVQNFISNAIKYSPSANEVLINLEVEQENIIVSIKDFGIGIDRKHLTKLFDRYYRVDNSATRFEGLGLGLFISADIVKRHDGSFWIDSELGQGTTFFFKLPLNPKKPIIAEEQTDSYYRNKYFSISCEEGNDVMNVVWVGHQDMHSVKHGGMLMIDYLKRNKCNKVFNDNREVLGTWSEASDWAATTWLPQMEQAGLQYFAWVLSPSAFSQLSAIKSADNSEKSANISFFSDAQQAMDWLVSV